MYVSVENSFPFGYNLPELIECLERDAKRVYYGLKGTISIVLSEGYGKKHQQFRALMKTLITQEGYDIKDDQSLSLLKASYAAETASILIKALKYFITEHKWDRDLIKLALRNIDLLSIKHDGVTGSIAINTEKKEMNSTFVVYNVIPSTAEDILQVQPRAYVFHAKSTDIRYVDETGSFSSKPTIVYSDGTTNPPLSTPQQSFLIPFISK